MKRAPILITLLFLLFSSATAFAANSDLAIHPNGFFFLKTEFIEGQTARIYINAYTPNRTDGRGVIKILDNNVQIQGDQPISVVSGKEDTVYVDWQPETAGNHALKATIFPYTAEGDNPSNNSIERTVSVFADTDRDGIPNRDDIDDDNDGFKDDEDAFPLNSREWLDTDHNGIGNNADPDDDNDGISDEDEARLHTNPLSADTDGDGINDKDDAFPLDPREWLDTDRDGIGNNADTDDDNDGISDADEARMGTDPLKADTDGDGVNDKNDVSPLNPAVSRDTDKLPPVSELINTPLIPPANTLIETNTLPGTNSLPLKTETTVSSKPIITESKTITILTPEGNAPPAIIAPNELLALEIGTSSPSSSTTSEFQSVPSVEWIVERENGAEKIQGTKLAVKFIKPGARRVTARIQDSTGQISQKSFTVFVAPNYALWIITAIIFIILILAIFIIFFYSSRRRSHWENFNSYLDLILKIIPKKKRK